MKYPRTTPCSTCPWRKSSTVGGADIPGFSIEKMRGLESTVGDGDLFRPVMACHGSTEQDNYPCVGYLAQEGWSNLGVRVMIMQGNIHMGAIEENCRDLDLWPDFETMLEAYEEAQ